MYNFDLGKNETLISIYDEVLVCQNDIQKIISVALTDKRLLFLDYATKEPYETLRVTSATNYVKIKEVFFYIDLKNIKEVKKDKLYKIIINNKKVIEFDNKDLYTELKDIK